MSIAGFAAAAILGALLTVSAIAQTAPAGGGSSAKPQATTSPPSVAGPALSFTAPAADRNAPPGVPVDINTASAAELGKVRFIGRKRAAAIIAGRPWRNPDDLVAKKVVPMKHYEQIKDRLVAR